MYREGMSIYTSLPLNKSTYQVDMLVCQANAYTGEESDRRCIVCVATSNVDAVVFKHDAQWQMREASITGPLADGISTAASDIVHLMVWLNTYVKRAHMAAHCSAVSVPSIAQLNEALSSLLPSVINDAALDSFAEAEDDGTSFRMKRRVSADGEPTVATKGMIIYEARMSDITRRGRIDLPMPIQARPEEDTLGVSMTLYLLGEMSTCFTAYTYVVDDIVAPIAATCPHNLGWNDSRYSIMYMHSNSLGNTGVGMSSVIGGRVRHTPPPHRHIGFSGVTCVDATRDRLVIFHEYMCNTIPFVCGCFVRDGVRFAQSHAPVVCKRDKGAEYTFSDLRDGVVRLSIDGVASMDLYLYNRTFFEDAWWIDAYAPETDATCWLNV